MQFSDTIFALSSGPLPAGVALIRLSGPSVQSVLHAMAGGLPEPRHAAFRKLRARDGRILDHCLILFFPGPGSFTGEDCAELHVHGGRAVVTAVLEELSRQKGLRAAEAGEFTRRAFLNGKLDLVEVEALSDLIAAETEAQRRLALENVEGSQSDLYAAWRQRVLHARAMIEAELDFADESDVPGSVANTIWIDMAALRSEIDSHLAGFRQAEIIRTGFRVVLTGAPNAGKSSLLNALACRDVAIVSDEPGTTRDVLEVALDLRGVKVVLTDTAGLRDQPSGVEAIGIARAREQLEKADLVLALEDMSGSSSTEREEMRAPVIRIGTKLDQASDKSGAYDLTISSTTGEGLQPLLDRIARHAEDAAGQFGEVLPSRLRHVELLRLTGEALSDALKDGGPLELRAESLRLSADSLGRIAGRIDVEDLLDTIFSQFCIGK